MRPSFEPLSPDLKAAMSVLTGVEVRQIDMTHWFCMTTYGRDGRVSGILACEPMSPYEWAFNAVLLDPHALSRKLLRVIFSTLFSRAVRVSAVVRQDNERALKQMTRLGFTYEGFLRMGIEGRYDGLLYSMLAWECPWIQPNPLHHSLIQTPPRAEMH